MVSEVPPSSGDESLLHISRCVVCLSKLHAVDELVSLEPPKHVFF